MSKKKYPPVFKLRAEYSIWKRSEKGDEITLRIVDEQKGCNAADLRAVSIAHVGGKLQAFGLSSENCELELVDYYTAKTRELKSPGDYEWELAVTYCPNEATRAKAIRELMYLPEDIAEQREAYGS